MQESRQRSTPCRLGPAGFPALHPRKWPWPKTRGFAAQTSAPDGPIFRSASPARQKGCRGAVATRGDYPNISKITSVIPAHAGIQGLWVQRETLDSRFRGNDGSSESTVVGASTYRTTKPPSPSVPPSGRRLDGGCPVALSEPQASLATGPARCLTRGQPAGPGRRGALLCLLSCRAARKKVVCRDELPAPRRNTEERTSAPAAHSKTKAPEFPLTRELRRLEYALSKGRSTHPQA